MCFFFFLGGGSWGEQIYLLQAVNSWRDRYMTWKLFLSELTSLFCSFDLARFIFVINIIAFTSEDLNCWVAWDTSCGHKAKDITPSIAWRREAHKEEDISFWKDEKEPCWVRPALELLPRRHWGKFWETGKSAYGFFFPGAWRPSWRELNWSMSISFRCKCYPVSAFILRMKWNHEICDATLWWNRFSVSDFSGRWVQWSI